MFMHRILERVMATLLAMTVVVAGAKAEKLRTWEGGDASDEVISLFERKYPDIEVE